MATETTLIEKIQQRLFGFQSAPVQSTAAQLRAKAERLRGQLENERSMNRMYAEWVRGSSSKVAADNSAIAQAREAYARQFGFYGHTPPAQVRAQMEHNRDMLELEQKWLQESNTEIARLEAEIRRTDAAEALADAREKCDALKLGLQINISAHPTFWCGEPPVAADVRRMAHAYRVGRADAVENEEMYRELGAIARNEIYRLETANMKARQALAEVGQSYVPSESIREALGLNREVLVFFDAGKARWADIRQTVEAQIAKYDEAAQAVTRAYRLNAAVGVYLVSHFAS